MNLRKLIFKKALFVAIFLLCVVSLAPCFVFSEIEKVETTQAINLNAQIMPEKDDVSVANPWFSIPIANGRMPLRLYNASSSQGIGRILLKPRPFGSVNNTWYDLYQSQYKYCGASYQNTFSNDTHTWAYCSYNDLTAGLRLKHNITLCWEYPFAKITPAIQRDKNEQNVTVAIRFDLSDFTFTKAMVSNITEPYTYSSPGSDQNVTLIDNSNRTYWDDNYVALYDANHNRSLIFSWQYKAYKIDLMEDQSEGKFGYLYWYSFNKTQNWPDKYVVRNSTFVSWTRTLDPSQSVANLKTVFSRYAHMALTHPTAITVERTTISDNRFNIKTNITFTDLSNEWSISPTHYTPCLVHSTASSYTWKERSAFGTIYFVQGDVATGYVDLHQTFYPSWLKYAYDNWGWLSSNRWLELTVGGAWSKVKKSHIYMYDHVQVLLTTCWLYQITNNATLLNYIKDGADWTVSVMHSNGNVTMYFDQNGAETGSYEFTTVHHALAYAYDITGNSTYLAYAEANANYETQNNLWMHNVTMIYHADNEIIGFTKLYLLTSNSTYKTWAQQAIGDCIDNQDTYLFGWYSSDISSSSHIARGIFYYLAKVGDDIAGYDLEASAEKYLDATWVQRDDWSSQLWGVIDYLNEYVKLPCHNEFPLTAFEQYCIYLVGNQTEVPRVFLALIYEDINWVLGSNELSTTFESSGGIKRSIQLDSGCSPYMFVQYQTYDQANFLWALIWMHELYEDLVQTDGQYLYSTTVRLDTRQLYIDYAITDPFVLSATQNLTALSYSSNKLTFTINSASGTTSITRLYCGDRGQPKRVYVSGAESFSESYDSSTKMLTINTTHSGLAEIVVDWRVPGDVNGDGFVDASDLFDLSKAYGSKPGDPNWNPDCDFTGDGKVDASDLLDLSENYGKTLP